MNNSNDQHSDEAADAGIDGQDDSTCTPEDIARPRARLRPWMERFLDGLRGNVGNVNKACVAAGVSRRTAYNYKASDQDFGAAWDEVAEGVIDEVEQKVIEVAKTGADPQSSHFILKTRRRSVYGDKLGIEVSGTVNHLHVHATPDQLADRVRAALPSLTERVMKVLPAKSDSQE